MIGREIELDPSNIAHGGIAVARLDGRVVFVADTIPGERVLARISDDRHASYWRADTIRVLEPSAHRRPHIWAEASVDRRPEDRPGGADFGHIELDHQRRLKAEVLRDALARHGGVERAVTVEPVPGRADGKGWRTRERLHIDADGLVGPLAARSHRVLAVDDLPLAVPAVREAAPLADHLPGHDRVVVLAPSIGGARLVLGEQQPTTIVEVVDGREFRVDDRGFWQVHEHAASALSVAVREAIDPELADPAGANLDLYGGVGLLAAAVADRLGPRTRITTVESDARATEHAAGNLADWVGAAAVTARVEDWVRGLGTGSAIERARLAAGTVVLDPPRAGAGGRVLEPLAAVRPAQIVYVACDPVALARDVGILSRLGYEMTALRALDLFPHTHHVEAVAAFRRR